jgi:hypothetical protein
MPFVRWEKGENQMTTHELQEEVQYRIEERLGILCGTECPTEEQMKLANDEADKWARENHPKLYELIFTK